MAKILNAADKQQMLLSNAENYRKRRFAEASAQWDALTKGKDEWPQEEHQARFEALLTKAMFTKPIK